jgi:hypothetical protein
MKWTVYFLFVIFVISGISCTNLDTRATEIKESFITDKPAAPKSPVMEQDNNIVSKDYNTAQKALKKAALEKNKKTIKKGLESPIITIRQKTAEVILELNDVSFVPSLIDALQGNQVIIDGGTEMKLFQQDLDKAIISALEYLTKLKFNLSNPISSKDINEVLDKSQEWCKSNKEVCNTNFK